MWCRSHKNHAHAKKSTWSWFDLGSVWSEIWKKPVRSEISKFLLVLVQYDIFFLFLVLVLSGRESQKFPNFSTGQGSDRSAWQDRFRSMEPWFHAYFRSQYDKIQFRHFSAWPFFCIPILSSLFTSKSSNRKWIKFKSWIRFRHFIANCPSRNIK